MKEEFENSTRSQLVGLIERHRQFDELNLLEIARLRDQLELADVRQRHLIKQVEDLQAVKKVLGRNAEDMKHKLDLLDERYRNRYWTNEHLSKTEDLLLGSKIDPDGYLTFVQKLEKLVKAYDPEISAKLNDLSSKLAEIEHVLRSADAPMTYFSGLGAATYLVEYFRENEKLKDSRLQELEAYKRDRNAACDHALQMTKKNLALDEELKEKTARVSELEKQLHQKVHEELHGDWATENLKIRGVLASTGLPGNGLEKAAKLKDILNKYNNLKSSIKELANE